MSGFEPMYDNEEVLPETDQTKLNQATDRAFKHLVETFQHGIIHLTNTGDTARLIALQKVTNELYRRADECMAANKQMDVFDIQSDN